MIKTLDQLTASHRAQLAKARGLLAETARELKPPVHPSLVSRVLAGKNTSQRVHDALVIKINATLKARRKR